ncbi:MAG: spore coat protein CotJB [Wujia sp.]
MKGNHMNKAQLLQFIDQVTFMLDDIALYLDTHPTCRQGLEAYEHYKMLRKEAVAEYQRMYGPLNRYSVEPGKDFNWINGPWPWEGACGC